VRGGERSRRGSRWNHPAADNGRRHIGRPIHRPARAEVVELGVVNATIHKVNECVRIEEIDALHRMYVGILQRLLT